MNHPQASRTSYRFAHPLAGGNTSGPAKPVPRCSWHAIQRGAMLAEGSL